MAISIPDLKLQSSIQESSSATSGGTGTILGGITFAPTAGGKASASSVGKSVIAWIAGAVIVVLLGIYFMFKKVARG